MRQSLSSRGRGARMRRAIALIAALSMLGVPPSAAFAAEEGSWYDGIANGVIVGFDAVILRPIGVVVLAAGCVLFVPAAVLSSPGGMDPIEEAYERFIEQPGQNVWSRPLGEY